MGYRAAESLFSLIQFSVQPSQHISHVASRHLSEMWHMGTWIHQSLKPREKYTAVVRHSADQDLEIFLVISRASRFVVKLMLTQRRHKQCNRWILCIPAASSVIDWIIREPVCSSSSVSQSVWGNGWHFQASSPSIASLLLWHFYFEKSIYSHTKQIKITMSFLLAVISSSNLHWIFQIKF